MSNVQAVCILVLRDGAVCAVQRKTSRPGEDAPWGLPGGKIDPGESPEEAAAREGREETGLPLRVEDLREIMRGRHDETGCMVVTYWAPDPGGALRPGVGEPPAQWVAWSVVTDPGPCAAFSAYNTQVRHAATHAIDELWIDAYGSGTLRRAREEGMRWRDLYLAERTALEFGYGFQAIQGSRLTTGEPLAEGDDPATTETCWWARTLRYRAEETRRLRGREEPGVLGCAHAYRVVHARLTEDDHVEEGLAILCDPAPWPSWLPRGRRLVAFTTDGAGRTLNPC